MKYLLNNIVIKNIAIVLITIVLLSFLNCTTETVDNSQDSSNISLIQEPQARVTNNGTTVVDLEIYDINGILVAQENGIEPGKTSSLKTFSAGETTFVVSSANSDKIIVLDMDAQMTNNMVIASNNQISSNQPILTL